MGAGSDLEKLIEPLYREMYVRLCIYAASALGDKNLAEEAVQDTFRIACMKAEELRKSENPQGWLMLTLKNGIRNIRRSQMRLNKLMITAFSVDESKIAAATDEHFALLYEDLLGSEDFRLLKMVSIERNTMLEAANEFGITVEACKKRVQRAKKRLRELLEKENF